MNARSRQLPGCGLLACGLSLLTAGVACAEAPRTQAFRGHVLAVDARSGSFVMERGASTRHPHAEVRLTPRTRWSGEPRAGRLPRLHDSVLVEARETRPDRFEAVTIRVFDPTKSRPAAARGGAAGP